MTWTAGGNQKALWWPRRRTELETKRPPLQNVSSVTPWWPHHHVSTSCVYSAEKNVWGVPSRRFSNVPHFLLCNTSTRTSVSFKFMSNRSVSEASGLNTTSPCLFKLFHICLVLSSPYQLSPSELVIWQGERDVGWWDIKKIHTGFDWLRDKTVVFF